MTSTKAVLDRLLDIPIEENLWLMERRDFEKILTRYRAGTCTAEERRLVESWFNHELSKSRLDGEPNWEKAKATIWKRIEPHRGKTIPLRRWLSTVAAALILAITTTWLFFGGPGLDNVPEIARQQEKDIEPGGNRATLTMSDGRTVALDEGQTGIVIDHENVAYQDGTPLVLPPSGSNKSPAALELVLTTPKGGTYQVTLPDGSHVWLNAASKLTYPSQFEGNERVVFLEGEAYFDVEKRPYPFLVKSNRQTVEVLGTSFNISAYNDDSETHTTLVEGKVRLKAVNGESVQLEPGEQASTGTDLEKTSVDVERYIAWKSGKFNFDGKPFAQVMKEVSRWYDLDVVYKGAIPEGQLIGDAYRDQNLSIVLGMLDVLEIDHQLNVSERKLTIYEKKGGRP